MRLLNHRIFLLSLAFLFFGTNITAADTCTLVPGQVASPSEELNLTHLAELPIQHAGRVKPLDTFARHILLQFSGRTSFNKKSALNWLAKLLFNPESTRHDRVFLVNNPDIATALEIPPQKKRRYHFAEFEKNSAKLFELAQASLKIEDKQRSVVEREIIRLFFNLKLYTELSRAFAFALPHPDFEIPDPELRQGLGLNPERHQFTFFDMTQIAGRLFEQTNGLERKNKSLWTSVDKRYFELMTSIFQWSSVYRDLPFKIIPPDTTNPEKWLSTWQALSPDYYAQSQAELLLLSTLPKTYRTGHQIEFDLKARNYLNLLSNRNKMQEPFLTKSIPLEIKYNQVNPFLWGKILYVLGFICFMISLLWRRKYLYQIVFIFAVGGFILHTVGIICRITILVRPPVTNLYETFLFVGWVSVLCGFIIERISRQGLGNFVSLVSGFTFLFIANRFSMEGDTLQMLVAVLNSNFWLSTHVTSITIGYSGCCVAGLIGHVYIIQLLNKSTSKKVLTSTYHNLLGSLGFGLTMTFLGTNLGGIWADQSWGRFWGWDPKENGALLIILWCAILFHARLGKMISPLGLAAGSVIGMIVVMWAWFGVNLLSVGLHSYGFTSGLARTLMVYFCAEVLFLSLTLSVLKRRGFQL